MDLNDFVRVNPKSHKICNITCVCILKISVGLTPRAIQNRLLMRACYTRSEMRYVAMLDVTSDT